MAIPRPRLKNTEAGKLFYDPMHSSIFEVSFSGLDNMGLYYGSSDDILTILPQQVTDVSGLDSLIKVADVGAQKFLGTTNSYANPTVDDTSAEITINFNLNLRLSSDAYVYEIFKAWYKRIYDVSTGGRSLMKDYVCETMGISEANRDGTIWRQFQFGKVILKGVSGLDALDYTNNEARKLTCVFKVDWWDEITNKNSDIHKDYDGPGEYVKRKKKEMDQVTM